MLKNISRSLNDLLGKEYGTAVCRGRAFLTGQDENELLKIADEKVDFYPAPFAARQEELMERVGESVCPPFVNRMTGAATAAYGVAQHGDIAPVNGLGAFRLAENGKLYFTGKSEHYQLSLGHSFPGYELIEKAKALGVTNATHNNTRGFVTRTLERRLIAAANGIPADDPRMEEILTSKTPGVLSAVINLETGSLAVEAALKMMLNRFHSLDGSPAPYEGKTPVFLVMGDQAGGMTGNYHGTTIFAQMLRGLWPGISKASERLFKVVPVPINDGDAFEALIRQYNEGSYKTAGFCHEIVLMNYGGIRLKEEYLRAAYELCRETDTPVLCDEIQTCAWYDGLFLFRRYGLRPDFVSVGKGFPGGMYPASRMLVSGAYDNLSQFGALVTNGQEELASLSYLITMEFIAANGKEIEDTGRYYHNQAIAMAGKHLSLLSHVDGDGQMTALCFHRVEDCTAFCKKMNGEFCVDISAQTYKPNCPPAALTKLPLILSPAMVDHLIGRYDLALTQMEGREKE